MRFALAITLATVVAGTSACSASTSTPATPVIPRRSLRLAFAPGPCAAGVNVVSASVFVSGPAQELRSLDGADGELRFALVFDGERPRPVTLRWLDVAHAPVQPLLGPPWNLELTFDSPRAGSCPIRVEFRPTPEGAKTGLGPVFTTIVLKDAPPPPPAGKP